MNKLILTVALATLAFSQHIFSQDSAKSATLLSYYYALKDALVSGNASQAATHAEAFQKAASSMDQKTVNKGTVSTLVADAGKIAVTKDLKKQREYFAGFSNGMTKLVKETKLSDQPVYVAYCPMKKAGWLTNSKAIKNPYYGSSMLTCGEIVETLP